MSRDLEAYESDTGRCPYQDWFDELAEVNRRAVQRRLRAIEEDGYFGDRKTLGKGLHELRFRQGMRIYFTETGTRVVLLLGGSGKGDQGREIRKARKRMQDYLQR